MYPEFKVFGISIPTYFAWLSIVYSMMIYWLSKRAEQDPRRLPPILALDAALWIILSSFIGARLLHVIWETPQLYTENWIAVLSFWNGGFVYYGGLAGGLIGLWFFCRWKRLSFWTLADFLAPMLAIGYGSGRLACFLGGCCFGAYCDLPWAVGGRHPVQIYAFVLDGLLGLTLLLSEKRWNWMKVPTCVSSFFLIGHGANRILMESLRMDFRGGLIAGLTISTWISILLILFGLGLQLKLIMKKAT